MNKRFAAALAATAVLGVTTAFAANPFSDVEAGHWAYQSVSQLASAGIINGYPDGTFQGQNNITRYEMAQMVAKAMANQDRANAEQNAMINRLADEFSSELNNLGVRVGNLEKRVGNVKVTGDFRVKYEGFGNSGKVREALFNGRTKKVQQSLLPAKEAEDSWAYRARLQFNATVNDSTEAVVRVTTNDYEFGDSDSNVEVDRAYVAHQFGKATRLELGRTDLLVGNGLFYDDGMDGVKAVFGNDKVTLTAAYGEAYISGAGELDTTTFTASEAWAMNQSDDALTYFGLNTSLSKVDLGAFYLETHDGMKTYDYLYGFSADANFDKVWVGGEWVKVADDVKEHTDKDAWTVGLGYGNYDQAKKGTWGVKAQYFDIGHHISMISSAYNVPANRNYKGWLASADYALLDNVGLNLNYGFSGETDGGTKYADYYRVELNYQF